MSAEERMVSQLQAISFEDLPNHIVERIQTILLHDLVVGMAGRHRKEFKLLSGVYSRDKVQDRILLEAVAMSQLALEDFYGANHFGPLMIPNVLYHGVKSKATGRALIASLVAGYATGIFLSDQLGGKVAEKGFRGTPVFGILAAAASTSHITGSSKQEFLHTLAHASANVFGLGVSLLAGTDEWRYQAGLGAYHAAFAHLLARNGEVGYSDFLSGNTGLAEVFAGSYFEDSLFDLSLIEKIGVKRHPVHIFVLSPVEAAKRLFRELGPLSPDAIQAVKVKVPAQQLTAVNLQKGPFERTSQAIVNIYTTVALTLLYGDTSQELLKKANDLQVIQLIEKMEILPDEELKEYQCELMVKISGERYTVPIDNALEMYFPSLQLEQERLVKEAEQWGVNPECVNQLVEEIKQLDDRNSLSILIDIYENGLVSRTKR